MDRITLITLVVANLLKSKDFYIGLGFTLDSEESDNSIAIFRTEGTKFSLYPIEKLAMDINEDNPPTIINGFSGIALAYNTTSKENVDKLFSKVKELGGVVQCEPQEVFWGGYHFYFRDLDGHYWEIAYAY